MADEKKPLKEGYQPRVSDDKGKFGYRPQQPSQQNKPIPPVTTPTPTPPRSDKKP